MFNDKKVVALIPARGGSKRLRDKNIRMVAGRYLVEWSILAGVHSKIVDEVVVSTDSSEIKSVALQCSADTVIDRPTELAQDYSKTTDVIFHTLNQLKSNNNCPNYVVLLQPTSPLRTAIHIDESFQLMRSKAVDGVISVCETEHPVEWMGRLPEDCSMDSFLLGVDLSRRSQDYEPSYQINGAIYTISVKKFLKERTLFPKTGMVAYVMERSLSVDVDDEQDLRWAEWLLNNEPKST